MDWTPVMTAVVSATAGLAGAGLGFVSTQLAARRNRAADRNKRCVDRLVEAMEKLEDAYLSYTVSTEGESIAADRAIAARLQAADRYFDQAVGLIDHPWIRKHATEYGKKLQTYYLFFGNTELDDLDADRDTPTAESLKILHSRLVEKLRSYEK